MVGPGEIPVCPVAKFRRVRLRRRTRPDGHGEGAGAPVTAGATDGAGADDEDTGRVRALLREHDDPDHLERPPHFDPAASARRFDLLGRACVERFGPACVRFLTQDTSHYGGVTVRPDVTGLERPLWVLLSNFGGFVTAGTGAEGATGAGEGLTEEFLTWLDRVCAAAGCVRVPVELLLEPYDGRAVLERMYAEPLMLAMAAEHGWGDENDEDDEKVEPVVWWERYFDYM